MKKFLKNNTETYIKIRTIGLRLSPGQIYEVSKLEEIDMIHDTTLISYIMNSSILVGSWTDAFYGDPYEGIVWLRTTFDNNTYVIDGETVTEFTPAIVEDSVSGKKSTSLFMDILTMMKEFYNNESNPIYEIGFQQLIGTGGREVEHLGRTLNLENSHAKTGWHRKEIFRYGMKAPSNLLIYYGYPNSFNSSVNAWYNEKVAQDMAKYDLIVLGNGVANPSHGDYSNTQIIIPRIKALNPRALIFGYVDSAVIQATFESNVDAWETLQVHGIFFDQCGYDYGTTDTNSRTAMNVKIEYVHDKTYAKLCFVNCWNMDHIIGTTNDASYPNTTWNSGVVASSLTYDDWYLLESFVVNTDSYSGDYIESKTDWKYRGDKAIAHRVTYGLNLAAVGIIGNSNVNAQKLFDFQYVSSLMYALEAVGSSDASYGSSSAAVTFWKRPNIYDIGDIWVENPSIQVDTGDSDIYWRYARNGIFKLDFSSGAYLSKIYRESVVYDVNFKKYTETVNTLGNCSGSYTVDLNYGSIITATITGTSSFAFSNFASSGEVSSWTVELTNGGAYTTTFTGVKWPGGTAPTLISSGVDVLSFYTRDGGTTIRGSLAMGDSK